MRTNSWTGSVRLGGAGRANWNNCQVSLRDSSLVIHGGIVIVRRAHADCAAVQLDVFEGILRSLFPRCATLPRRRRSLRRFEERFRRRVVRRRAEPRHGSNDAMGAGSSGKPSRRIRRPGRHGARLPPLEGPSRPTACLIASIASFSVRGCRQNLRRPGVGKDVRCIRMRAR